MNKLPMTIIRNGVLYKVENEEDMDIIDTVSTDENITTMDNETDKEDQLEPICEEHLQEESLPEESLPEENRQNHLLPEHVRQKIMRLESLPREHLWDRANTDIFLDECVNRKKDLRNPSVRRRKIFNEIRLRMMEHGYNFDDRSLDRKFRNLKTHYFYVRNNNKKRRTNRITWPYFEKMSQIFPSDAVRNARMMKSLHSSTSTLQLSSPRTFQGPDKFRKHSSRQEDSLPKELYSHPNKLEVLRHELLVFEERRTIAIEAIAAELVEANRLTRERLELEKKRLQQANIYTGADNIDEG